MLPELVDEVKIRDWEISLKKVPSCFLYDFESLGVSLEQFKELIVGRKALLFEKPFKSNCKRSSCPWCDAVPSKNRRRWWNSHTGGFLSIHVFSHPGKTIISPQVLKFQEELYSLRLKLNKQGWHESLAFLVEHECQVCERPLVEGRRGMCAVPTATRNRMRCLKTLGYPIKQFTHNKKRIYDWSCMGVIVLR